jgi:hypothetical protein
MSVSNSGLPIQELNCFVDLSLFQEANKHGRIHPLTDINSKKKRSLRLLLTRERKEKKRGCRRHFYGSVCW